MKNKKVKISVVATAVALSMTTAVSVGAAVSAQESTGIPNTAMARIIDSDCRCGGRKRISI